MIYVWFSLGLITYVCMWCYQLFYKKRKPPKDMKWHNYAAGLLACLMMGPFAVFIQVFIEVEKGREKDG